MRRKWSVIQPGSKKKVFHAREQNRIARTSNMRTKQPNIAFLNEEKGEKSVLATTTCSPVPYLRLANS